MFQPRFIRIKTPLFPAARSVQRHNRGQASGDIHDSVDYDGGAFNGGALTRIAGVKVPGDLKAFDVRSVDLVEGRVTCATLIVADVGPVNGLGWSGLPQDSKSD